MSVKYWNMLKNILKKYFKILEKVSKMLEAFKKENFRKIREYRKTYKIVNRNNFTVILEDCLDT